MLQTSHVRDQGIRNLAGDSTHVLIVEDDEVARTKLAGYLETVRGTGVKRGKSTAGGLRQVMLSDPVDLVLLDINLPGEDGLDLTRFIRAQSDVGIILVTGRTDDVDRILGLEIGADDYVTKPFNPRELLARVKTLLRRTDGPSPGGVRVEDVCRLALPTPARAAWCPPRATGVALTRAEFELLNALIAHPGTVLTRERLLGCITHRSWDPGDRTVDVLVRRLRQKLEVDPQSPELIITVHGEGYMFAARGLRGAESAAIRPAPSSRRAKPRSRFSNSAMNESKSPRDLGTLLLPGADLETVGARFSSALSPRLAALPFRFVGDKGGPVDQSSSATAWASCSTLRTAPPKKRVHHATGLVRTEDHVVVIENAAIEHDVGAIVRRVLHRHDHPSLAAQHDLRERFGQTFRGHRACRRMRPSRHRGRGRSHSGTHEPTWR